MPEIKIISGHSNPGGSTVANIELCNLFNDKGLSATFYGPHDWHMGQCKSDKTGNLRIADEDLLIVHYLVMPIRPAACRKLVLSCHETSLYPIRSIPCFWDTIHFVSSSQQKWQGVDGIVIPNRMNRLESGGKTTGTAGVIGSIDANKRTHVSIQRALEDGFATVRVFGEITDKRYYDENIKGYVESGRAAIMGFENNRQYMYDSVDAVYHSSSSETFNLIRSECASSGTAYHGMETADPEVELLDDNGLFSEWSKLLEFDKSIN